MIIPVMAIPKSYAITSVIYSLSNLNLGQIDPYIIDPTIIL